MARRALILGSQIEGLRGVGNDCQRMAAMLDARDFVIDLRLGEAATRAGMLAGYDQLIGACGPDDAAVIYYCGHGYHATVPEEGRSWQCIAPFDVRAGTNDDWRGITAWELSIKQAQLTERTRNVTVILDCCHSAQLSRSDGIEGAVPRALPHPVNHGFERHLGELRATYRADFDAVHPVGNANAVRVVACGQSESAYEYPDASGQYHGVFTDVLIDVLAEVGDAAVSWSAIMSAVRARVLRRFVRQRPDIEGPVRRGLFTLREHDDLQRASVAAEGDHYRLSVGRVAGAAVGDIYTVLGPGSTSMVGSTTLARLEVVEVLSTTASARRISGVDPIPADAVAVRTHRCAPRCAVRIDGAEPARMIVEHAIGTSSMLRTAVPGELGVVATVRVSGDSVTLEDAQGPLFPPAAFPAELDRVLAQAANLGIAQSIRELEGEHGIRAADLAIELGTVREDRMRPFPDHGAIVRLDERYYARVESLTQRTLFVHLLGIGAQGKVTLLTHFARSGVALDPRARSLTLGQRADGALVGVGLHWPDGLPATGGPRLVELVVIATRTSIDLSGLETSSSGTLRSKHVELPSALAQLRGQTYRGESDVRALDGFCVKRLSMLLAPDHSSIGGNACARGY